MVAPGDVRTHSLNAATGASVTRSLVGVVPDRREQKLVAAEYRSFVEQSIYIYIRKYTEQYM